MKKKYIYIKTAILSLASMAMLSSCLKDNAHYVDFAGSKPLVEFPAATPVGGLGGILQPIALDIAATPTPVNIVVNVAAPKPLSSALTVKISVDAAALAAYNTANSTSFVLLPAADYSSSLSVTVPANQNLANLVINVNTSLIDPSQSYVLPITITDAGGQQISNYKTLLLNVQAKNKYDGTYAASGDRLHPVLGDFTFSYNVKMGTSGGSSIDGGALADLHGDLNITILPDNTVTVASSTSPTAAVLPGTVNKYDPATKTFTLHYFYNNAAPRIITETLVRQ